MPLKVKTIEKKNNDKTLISKFKKAYAESIVNVCRYLTHNDDGAIDYYRLRGRGYIGGSYETIKIIYQAGKPNCDDEIDNGHILILIDKKIRITNKIKEEVNKVIEEVNELLVEDFSEMMEKTEGEWYRPVNQTKVSSILDLNCNIHYSNDNRWSYSFTPIDDIHGALSSGWIPKRVKEIYDEYTSDDYEHNEYVCESLRTSN